MIKDEILKNFSGKSCLVTGGTGMIGRAVVDVLKSAGADVFVVSLDDAKIDGVEVLRGDLTDFDLCKAITQDTDFVFHIAGIKGSVEVTKSKPASFFVPLMQMNTNVLEACRLNKVQKVVYTSSIGAYPSAEVFVEDAGWAGDPMDSFPGWAKRMAEKQIEAYRIQYDLHNFAIVRPCSVFGPFDNFDPNNAMVIPSLIARIASGENPVKIWGDGSAIRDFLYSKDCAEGIVLALYHGTRDSFVNLGSGWGCSIKHLAYLFTKFAEFNYEFDITRSLSGFSRRVMDISRAKEWLDWQPTTSLFDGLQETFAWYMDNKNYLGRHNYFVEDQRC